jgi:hypothetical protein
MDGLTNEVTWCMESRMNVEFWIELVIVVLRIVAAGAAG